MGITEKVADRILRLQPQCVVCGSSYALHIHHRIFRSEGEGGLHDFLKAVLVRYTESYRRNVTPWHLHEVQNLVVLCLRCHEGNVVGVHGGNERLRMALRNSFTCPVTGFNVPFVKICKNQTVVTA